MIINMVSHFCRCHYFRHQPQWINKRSRVIRAVCVPVWAVADWVFLRKSAYGRVVITVAQVNKACFLVKIFAAVAERVRVCFCLHISECVIEIIGISEIYYISSAVNSIILDIIPRYCLFKLIWADIFCKYSVLAIGYYIISVPYMACFHSVYRFWRSSSVGQIWICRYSICCRYLFKPIIYIIFIYCAFGHVIQQWQACSVCFAVNGFSRQIAVSVICIAKYIAY